LPTTNSQTKYILCGGGKKKSMDGEFQESKFIDEEFRHEDVEDPSQGFVDWDSPPTYDDDVNEKDQIEEP
jgi:hypothetical protein